MHGLLSWIKESNPKNKQYAQGFTNDLQAIGSLYVLPTPPSVQVLDLTAAQVTFAGGNLSNLFTETVTYDSKGKFTCLGTHKLSLTLNKANGLFTGSVVDPAGGKAMKFTGAVLQKQNAGTGFLLGTNRSARVVLAE
jgi:hypothetical protein